MAGAWMVIVALLFSLLAGVEAYRTVRPSSRSLRSVMTEAPSSQRVFLARGVYAEGPAEPGVTVKIRLSSRYVGIGKMVSLDACGDTDIGEPCRRGFQRLIVCSTAAGLVKLWLVDEGPFGVAVLGVHKLGPGPGCVAESGTG